MADSDIPKIDKLLDVPGSPAIPAIGAVSDPAIGAIQDLLRGHGYRLPQINAVGYGLPTSKTKRTILEFRNRYLAGSAGGDIVDAPLLRAMVDVPAKRPICSRVYVSRKLNLDFKAGIKVACYVAIGEGKGELGALCLNTDKAGLSAGMIQWAQRPERLNELLQRFDTVALRPKMDAAFGGTARVTQLLIHTAKRVPGVTGGVTSQGVPLPADAAMNLIQGFWPAQFRELFLQVDIQKAEVEAAAAVLAALKPGFDGISPADRGERLVAYLADVGNQFGAAVARKFFANALGLPGLPPATLATQEARDILLINEITRLSNDRLTTIGRRLIGGKQKWSDAFIASVVKSRTDRAAFFLSVSDLSHGAVPL